MIHPDDMRFSSASFDLLTRLKYAVHTRLSDQSVEHARQAGREVVTEQDVIAVLPDSLAELAAEVVRSANADRPARVAAAVAG